MADVSLNAIRKSFGSIEVIKGVDLDIKSGEFIVFVGPSGCGKSTLLRMIAGLEDITSGALAIGGKDMTDEDPAKRGIAMVFQTYALYPHMTVRENMGFALRFAGMDKKEIEARVMDAAKMLELETYLDRKPKALSGGQRQRVAIGRAIVRHPDVFLFDEPLSNLDAELRVHMRGELSALHNRLKTTMIYVTHDQVEAMTLANRIVVLRQGIVEQIGTPLELFNTPANLFVAGFIGSPAMNFLPATVEKAEASGIALNLLGEETIDVPLAGGLPPEGSKVTVGVRPQNIRLAETGEKSFAVDITLVEALGTETVVYATAKNGERVMAVLSGQHLLKTGAAIDLAFDVADVHLFDEAGQRMAC
ncbi:sn-glycerol-3-phosphate ABC transporter ATP-binding protein UgpC [Martelella lutilitoris]|uniref:sn-glycerol-3-phosphate ABC transporter ATP-binding protein UgpC n=1 Tax=Martelella lutilitoris TaxID=2583532 RepID=A0A5C4JUA5_9HYPH|nr:sn-glycerol-3-phosphate ABC transporter ATP-binding protein UgpC [Martelella lutilitoris]TNB48784.1 sn-glycerol-3-phosphate ABC transporter ATP-binding protein UgpC [Martelella lutilitoris]